MRVQTGTAKGRKLKTPSGINVRPTSGRVKKSIFDTLGNIEDTSALDLFAGTGSLGLEALSRGAKKAVFVEKEREAIKIISDNIEKCGFADRSEIISTDYKKAIRILEKKSARFDLVFIDPPYEVYQGTSPGKFVDEIRNILSSDWEIVIEHDRIYDLEGFPGYLETRTFGSTQISYFGEELT